MNIKELKPGSYKVIDSKSLQDPGPFGINTEDDSSQPSAARKAFTNVGNFFLGATKGVVSTVKGAADLGEKIFEPITDTLTGTKSPGQNTDIIPERAYTPSNTAQKIGFGTEQVLEFIAPTGLLREAELAINAASKATKTNAFVKAATRIGGKTALEATAGGGVSALQTGGDVSETTKTALMFGATKLVTGTVGEVLKAFKIPERLYNTVFKSTYDDALNELKTTALSDLQRTDPKFFEQATKAGIIKTAANGAVKVDERLAKEALDRGLKGSLQNMAKAVVKGQVKSELQAQKLAAGFPGKIDVGERQYYNVLKEIAQDYQNVGFGELSEQANKFAQLLVRGQGSLTGTEGLALRRFLDKMRIATSFTQDNPFRLSQTQANFKFLANSLRTRINAIPGMGDVMKDYSFYIDALEALAKEAKRRGNNQVLSLIDSIFFSTGMASGNPVAGVSAGAARKLLNSPSGATRMGSAIEDGVLTKPGAATKGAASELLGVDSSSDEEEQEADY